MKCLLCSSNFDTEKDLVQQYINYHKVDENNKFFQKLLPLQKKSPIFRKCLRCNDFITTSSYKVKHEFLKHYDHGQDVAFEYKPLDIIRSSHIIKYEISVKKFSQDSKLKPAGPVLIKCGFIIKNIQQSISENLRPILNTCYWSTDAYKATHFNDYVFYSPKQNILSKVISNGMSGSSWWFNRFVLINVTVLKLEKEIVR